MTAVFNEVGVDAGVWSHSLNNDNALSLLAMPFFAAFRLVLRNSTVYDMDDGCMPDKDLVKHFMLRESRLPVYFKDLPASIFVRLNIVGPPAEDGAI